MSKTTEHISSSSSDESSTQRWVDEINSLKEEIQLLKKSNELYEKSNRDARVGTWEVDTLNEVIFWSTVTKEIHGVPPDYVPQMSTAIEFFKEGDSRNTILAHVSEAIATGKSYDVVLEILNTKGESIWVRTRGVAEFNNGICIRIYGTFQDVTIQHIQTQQIAFSEKKFKAIFDSTFQFIGFLSTDGTLQEANETALNFAGLLPADVVGKKFWDCHWWQSSEFVKQQLKEAIEVAASGQLVQYEVAVLDDKKLPNTILFNLKPLFNEDGKVIAIIPEGRPIQDIVDARNALIKKNEELEQFAYVASHDLREPLRMVKGFLGLLEKKYADIIDADGKKYIDYAVDGAERMRELIEGLLNFATVGFESLQKQRVNMNDVLVTVKGLLSNSIEESKAEIISDDLPTINASALYMQLLLQNLLGNAIKYQTGDKIPMVHIICESKNDHWLFSIKDNGIGIKKEYYDSIFKIFKRLHSKADYAGAGLGLSTSLKIVEGHAGKIWVDSESGVGSTFYFTIPK